MSIDCILIQVCPNTPKIPEWLNEKLLRGGPNTQFQTGLDSCILISRLVQHLTSLMKPPGCAKRGLGL